MRRVMNLLGLRGSVWILNAWTHRVLSVGQHGNEALSYIHLKKNPSFQGRCLFCPFVCHRDIGVAPVYLGVNSFQELGCSGVPPPTDPYVLLIYCRGAQGRAGVSV